MHDLVPFQFNGHDVPAIRDDQGEPWWKAADVCEQCDIKNVSKACERLDADEKAVITLSDTTGRPQEMLIVNEAGLYTLVLSSRKAVAKTFKRWVTHDVIPQIRKTGRYDAQYPKLRDPAMQVLLDVVVQLDEARALATEAKAEAVTASANAHRALATQQFFTVAEYVAFERIDRKVQRSEYRAISDHLRLYCMDRNIPFRTIPVGGKAWKDEYGFHVSVYAEAFTGWLKRRDAQPTLHAIRAT